MNHLTMLNTIMDTRHSCRGFLLDAVPRADVEAIVATAQKVPSWCNAQPWQLIVTDKAATDAFRTALYQHALTSAPAPDLPWPRAYEGVYDTRRRTCGFQLYDAVGVRKEDRPARAAQMMENFNLFGAPHVAIVTTPEALGPYGMLDCGGFISAFTVAAAAMGVSSIAQAAVAEHAPFVRGHFDIGADRHILCAISFGYADPDHPANGFRTDRATPNDVVDWR